MCFMSSGYWHALVFFFGSYFFFQGDTLGPAMWVRNVYKELSMPENQILFWYYFLSSLQELFLLNKRNFKTVTSQLDFI